MGAKVALSSTTLLVIIVATLVSRSFVKAGHKLSIVGVVSSRPSLHTCTVVCTCFLGQYGLPSTRLH